MLASHDHALVATGDTRHGWSGRSAPNSSESKKNFPAPLFPVLPSLVNAAPPLFFMQCRAQDDAEVVELREEVT
jgi:hypothetical protein